MNGQKKIVVGIVGAGNIAQTIHLPVLKAMDNVIVKWITDVDKEKANLLAKSYETTVVESIVNAPVVDIVLLTIPYAYRSEYYQEIKNRNCAVYLEKPIALTVKEHNMISSLLSPYKIACGFQRRSWGPTLLVKELIDNKIFGKLKSVVYELGNPVSFVGAQGFVSNPQAPGGGILFEVGIHGLDTILFCTSAESVNVRDVCLVEENGVDIHTNARFDIAVQANIVTCETTVSKLKETKNRLEFRFDDAILSYSLFSSEGKIFISPCDDQSQSYVLTRSANGQIYPITGYQTFYEHWQTFIDGLLNKEINRTSITESIRTTELIENIYSKGRLKVAI